METKCFHREFNHENKKIYVGEPFYEERKYDGYDVRKWNASKTEPKNKYVTDTNFFGLSFDSLYSSYKPYSYQKYWNDYPYIEYRHVVNYNIPKKTYNLWEIIEELVKRSHTHECEITNDDYH